MTTVSPEIIKRIEDKILETLLVLQKRYPSANLDIPTWKWNPMGRTAGRAHYLGNLVELNPDFINNHLDELINQTLPHEIAHLVSVKVYGLQLGRGHGRFWKSVMYALSPLDVEVRRCHDYSLEGVSKIRPRPYEYVCHCKDKTFSLTANIHGKIQRGQKRFCTRCKATIILKSTLQQAA